MDDTRCLKARSVSASVSASPESASMRSHLHDTCTKPSDVRLPADHHGGRTMPDVYRLGEIFTVHPRKVDVRLPGKED